VPIEPSFPPAPRADQQLLALHALRQRQLRAALLHGRSRNWRDRRRIWPAVVAAMVIVALLIAGVSVVAAFRRQQELDSAAVTQSIPAMVDPVNRVDLSATRSTQY
jgi:hypothetical protein